VKCAVAQLVSMTVLPPLSPKTEPVRSTPAKQRVDVIASPGDTIQIDQFLASHDERLRYTYASDLARTSA
jgi:hypothetical protein